MGRTSSCSRRSITARPARRLRPTGLPTVSPSPSTATSGGPIRCSCSTCGRGWCGSSPPWDGMRTQPGRPTAGICASYRTARGIGSSGLLTLKRSAWLVLGGLAVAGAAACGGGPKPQTPAPQPNADSAAAAEQARRDSIERARQDSMARAMAEAERNRRQREADSLAALGRSAEAVRTLLGTMIHFDFDKANIRSDDAAVLDQKIAILQANPNLRIR